VFQAKLRMWRRLAAGLVLVPGFTGAGADALGLVNRAAGQERSAPNRADEARDLMRRAREAYDAQNFGLAKELAEKARALKAPGTFYDDQPDDVIADAAKKPAPRTSAPPAAAATSRSTSSDPKVLTVLAKQAFDVGDLDKAQDLAMQAQPMASTVKWGLFEDTPASILKDVSKARGRRDKDVAERLMVEARQLIEKQTATRTERAANLTAAEEKARQAAGLHGQFSMWDFGDRPADLIADARKAREKEKLIAMKGEPQGDEPAPLPKTTAYGAKKANASTDDAPPAQPTRQADGTRKKAAIALMQEARALEVGKHFVEAKKKYTEAAKLNAAFGRDEDTPETELARINVAAQRKIQGCLDEAQSCMDRRDHTTARIHLDDAHALATGMGLDASIVIEMKASLKTAAPTRVASKPVDEQELPKIKNGSRPSDEPIPMPIIRNGRKPVAEEPGLVTAGADDVPPITPIPTAKLLPLGDTVKPIPSTRPAKPDADLPPPLPTVPDTSTQSDLVKPPMADPEVKKPTKPTVDKGQELLRAARTELKNGDTEAARKIAIELLAGPYDCKDEAKSLLSSIETKDASRKMADAQRAFAKAQEAFVSGSYAQAVAIFKQIDPMMLTAADRKVMSDMLASADAQEKKVASTGPDGLPKAPKPAAGVPDLPSTGAAPAPRTGSDNLVKQQEALGQVEFQRLRTKALRVESEATARFGKGETDEALMDLSNFIAEVKATKLEPSKQAMLCRPVEARMDRLKILKHQTDFLTKESKERRDFKSQMTQESLVKMAKQTDVAKLMKEANKLSEEHKYKEAYAKLQMAGTMDPDDASVQSATMMAKQFMRIQLDKKNSDGQEQLNFELKQGLHDLSGPTEGVKFRNDPEWLKMMEDRKTSLKSGALTIQRSRSESEKAIERKMSTPISVNFKATPLDAVIDQLRTMTNINFDLDTRRMKEENVDAKQPITSEFNNISLKSALDLICRQAGLRHAIESEVIRISTSKGLQGRQTVRSIPVGDLVIPAPNYGAHPGMSLMESLKAAQDAAYGKPSADSAMRNGPNSLPGGMGTGSSSLPTSPNRIRSSNAPMDGGANSNTGPQNGTLERELIRLITNTIKPDSWMAQGGEGSIEYYPLGMQMVINQSPEVIEEVERLLESLRKLQDLEVSIEVKVVSLAETFFERIGVDFSMGIPTNAKPVGGPGTGTTVPGVTNRNFGGNVVGLAVPGVATPDLDIPIRATSFGRAVPPFGGFNNSFADGGISLGLAFLSDIQVQMFLEAAQGDTRTNVMQAPKLTALNGTAASMTVGDYQFFLTGITVASVGGQLVFTPQNVPYAVGITQPIPPNASIQNGLLNFTPTQPQTPGLGLFIQPVVSADRRFVRLNIQQSFTNLITGTQQVPITTIITPVFENGGQGQPVPFTQYLQQPRFSNLETQTVVVVPDGGTVVMGGLKYMTEGRNEFGPPVLGKIPYLNRLFRNVAYGREGRSILIMVTPRVIINREEQERQTGVRDDDFVGLVGP
jgi:type II secretory pathway component GspD/PulD (secretin)